VLESDPLCAYLPPAWARRVERGEAEDVDGYFARRIPGWGTDVLRRPRRAVPASPES